MRREQLHERLERLRGEIARIDPSDEKERDALRQLGEDIDELLAETEGGDERYERLTERLKERVAELEATHPRATLMIGQVVDALAGIGL